MKILHVITRLVHGGAQANTIITCAHQISQGHEVLLASGLETGPEGSLWDMARERGVPLAEIPSLLRDVAPAQEVKAFFALLRLIGEFRPDVIHTHTSKAGMLARWAAWLRRVPVIIHTPHGHVFHGYFGSAISRFWILLERVSAWITDSIVVLTPAERDEHVEVGIAPPSKFALVPSGVDLGPFLGVERSPGAVPRVGCVARLAPIKGVLDLVEAFPHVVAARSDATLTIVGDGPQREEIVAAIERLGLKDRVRLAGYMADVRPVLAETDVLVVPSHNEGMGRVAVEGMAAGLPVVATRIGGLKDVVHDGETGFTVPSKDPVALARAIVDCLSDPARARRFGEAGRKRAWEYSQEVMLERLDDLYARLTA